MSKRQKYKKKIIKKIMKGSDEHPLMFFDYYQRPFLLFHEELSNYDYGLKDFSRRQSFWQFVPPGQYGPSRARPLVIQYLKVLERDLSNLLSKQSIAYWLHLYRRLAPDPIGNDKRAVTIYLVRATLEAAIMKYARFHPCNRIGITGQIPVERIMRGILMGKDFEIERNIINNSPPQLVLTCFGTSELREFYLIEKLCFEVWWVSAVLRGLGKGAPLIIEENPFNIYTDPPDELRKLLKIFDNRIGKQEHDVSSTGTVFFETKSDFKISGNILTPVYNVNKILSEDLKEYFKKAFGLEFIFPIRFNFIWNIFNLRDYYQFHKPFAKAFKEKYRVSFESIMLIIAALWCRIEYLWSELQIPILYQIILKYWHRAYEGPYKKEFIKNEIQTFFPRAKMKLGINDCDLNDLNLDAAMEFFTLNDNKRSIIDIGYPGPHMVFLPFGSERLFIDYAWISRRLYDLFFGVNIPRQHFKGNLLEMYVRCGQSILPIGPCKSFSREERQIDAAFEVGDCLVIVECRAIGRAISFERGDPEAIKFRIRKINEALAKIDEAAIWLAQNPEGRNYNIKKFSYIIPIAITPFNEFIPSLDSKYWLTEDLPRVLTPVEFKEALEKDMLTPDVKNLIEL